MTMHRALRSRLVGHGWLGPAALGLAAAGAAVEAGAAQPRGAAPTGMPAECYAHTQVPALGMPREEGQAFVDLDEQGRVLLDAVPDWEAEKSGRSMRTAFLWAGGEPQAIEIEGFSQTRAQDMNERGEVLVTATRRAGPEPGYTDAFVWRDGEVVAWIPAPLNHEFVGGAINELGHVALTAFVEADEHFSRGFRVMLWRDGGLSELGRGFVGDLRADADEIAGLDPAVGQPLLWRGTERVPLAPVCGPPGDFGIFGAVLLGPDDGDDVIATLECPEAAQAFVWRSGEPHALPTIDGLVLYVTGRNEVGDVVGNLQAGLAGSAESQIPAMWRDGEIVVLPLPPETDWGEVAAVNDDGVFIGSFYTEDAGFFFVGGRGGAQLLPLEEPWRTRTHPGAINNHGVIVNSISEDNDTSERTYLWRPVACEDEHS